MFSIVISEKHNDLPASETSGVKAQNEEWLTEDIPYGVNSVAHMARIFFSINKSAAIEFSLNSGSTWAVLKRKTSVAANEAIMAYVPLRIADLLNFRSPEVGGVTLIFFRVDYVDFESGAVGV